MNPLTFDFISWPEFLKKHTHFSSSTTLVLKVPGTHPHGLPLGNVSRKDVIPLVSFRLVLPLHSPGATPETCIWVGNGSASTTKASAVSVGGREAWKWEPEYFRHPFPYRNHPLHRAPAAYSTSGDLQGHCV